MPELPEVETIRRDLKSGITGLKIIRIRIFDPRVIRHAPVKAFTRRLLNKRVDAVDRRGKAIVIRLEPGAGYWVIQPMMTGQLILRHDDSPEKATKVTFLLSNGKYLHYNDQRLFGRLLVVDHPDDIPYLRKIGPEPLSPHFHIGWLTAALAGRRTGIKALLMDHRFVAGIGNIYASEILFRSRIHPLRAAESLKAGEIRALTSATVTVLKDAVRQRGTSMRNYRDGAGNKGNFMNRIRVYGRDGRACPRCGWMILKTIIQQRSTFFCGTCQPLNANTHEK